MSRRGWAAFAAMCLIWGVPYLLIKIAVEEIAPTTLVLARTGLAALVLLPIAGWRGQLRGLHRSWRPLLAYTVAEICIPFVALGYAETRLSSSVTGLLISAVPLVGALIARFTGSRERLGRRRIAGLGLGVAGVALLVGVDLGGTNLPALGALTLVVLGYAIGPAVLARHLADQPGLGVIAASLAITALVYLVPGTVQAPTAVPSAEVVAAVLALALVCTALAFVIFFALIAEAGPARATVITYVNPAVAVLLGVLLLDEPFTATTAAGSVLVLAGSVLATSMRRAPDGERRGAGGRAEPVPVRPVPEP